MFSLRKFFGHDEKFFDLLEASAEQADSSVHHLVALLGKLEHHDSPASLDEFVHSRRKDKEITQELTEQLCKTFITPLEREDIQALAAALYKIPKTVEKMPDSRPSKETPTSWSWICCAIFTTAIMIRSKSFFCGTSTSYSRR